jgi:hypothetical protein
MGSIEASLEAAADMDLVCARVRLGRLLDGQVPQVKEKGVVDLKGFRHPVLVLKEMKQQQLNQLNEQTQQQQQQQQLQLQNSYASSSSSSSGTTGGLSSSSASSFHWSLTPQPALPPSKVVGNNLSLNASTPGLVRS